MMPKIKKIIYRSSSNFYCKQLTKIIFQTSSSTHLILYLSCHLFHFRHAHSNVVVMKNTFYASCSKYIVAKNVFLFLICSCTWPQHEFWISDYAAYR